MFGKKCCINFSLLFIGSLNLFLQENVSLEIAKTRGGGFNLAYQIVNHFFKYGVVRGFGDKDLHNAIMSVEYNVQKMAESIGLPIKTEEFKPLDYNIVLQMLKKKLQNGKLNIPEQTLKKVWDKVEKLEQQRLELKNKLDEENKINEKEMEEIIKKLSIKVKGIKKLVDELKGLIEKVLEVARTDAMNACGAAEFFVKKLGFGIRVRFSRQEDEYMRRKVNEVDGTIVVKVYTENEEALRQKLEEVSKEVTFEKIYDKVLAGLNKEELKLWNQKKEKPYFLPMKNVKDLLEKVHDKKVELEKQIDIPSNDIEKRAEISQKYANQVNELNDAVKELAKIADKVI